ncbi:MAG: ABC transporter ATP-binding protein/permease [Clostridiales bacterium]|jgi:ATP-binding cassette subfamily B protein|nr:ABC transporter ATP-binding protein/permease [Clostridiales bacterium]
MKWLQELLMLSDDGFNDLKKSTLAVFLSNLSMFLPVSVLWAFVEEILKPLSGGEVSMAKLWLLCLGGAVSVVVVFLFFRNDYRKTYVVAYEQSEGTRIKLAEHIRKLPMSLFNSKDLTDLTTNMMGDVANNEHIMSHGIPQLFANALSITLICALLSIYDWRMSLAVFCSLPISFFVIYASRKLQTSMGKKHVVAKLAASGQVQEYIEGIKVIRACNMDGEKFGTLEKALRTLMKLAIKMEFGTGTLVTGASAILQAGIGVTVYVGSILFSGGQIELMPFLLFLIVVTKVYSPVLVVLTLLPEVLYFMISSRRLRDLMAMKTMEGKDDIVLGSYDIELKNVGFSYNQGGDAVIKDMTASIKQGEITALVGPSGSGKSTVSRLAARFWDVGSGKITIGGVDVKDFDPEHLMSFMSFVFQDVILFNDTVINNIRVGKNGATDEEVYNAAKAAHCDEFISKIPGGYEAMLGENGATLSGGERQRISIARALLKDAPIVLLDEATASLDPENEASIQQAISALIAGKTVIVIAHRLRTITEAGNIIVLNEGRIAQQGTHNELMKQGGLYKKLFDLQQESMGWSLK